MMKYLDRERVVGIGELGYNVINDLEEEVFLKQLDIAVQKNMLITIHLPHNNKVEGMKRIKGILRAKTEGSRVNRYDRQKILVDHNVEETIELDTGTRKLGWSFCISCYKIISRKSYRNN